MQKMGSPNWKKLKNLLPYAILFLITLFFVRHFFTNALLDGDDAPHHSGRVAAYYLALKQGQFPVRWAHNFDNGLGSPLFVLMYHLPYATAAFLYAALPITIQFSINLSYILSTLLGVLFMYSLFRSHTYSTLASGVGALTYLFLPYTLINLFAREAFGEMFFFGFLPLTLFIIKKQSEEEKLSHFSVLLPPILSLFLLSHPISLFFAVPLITIYCYVLYRESLHWKRSVVLCSIGVATSLWFWIPAYVERTFTTFISNNHFDEYLTHFPNPISYFWTANFSSIQYSAVLPHVTPGLTIYVVMVFAGILFFLNKKISRIFIVFFALFLLSILMQMRISTPLWEMISLLKNTQFPWRFLWISVIATSVLVAELVHLFRTHPHTQRIFLILVCASLLLSIRNFGNPRSFTKVVDNQWLLFGGTANAFDEHRPIWLNAASSREEHENVVLLSDSTERNEITPLDSKHIQTWDSTVHRYTVVLDKPTLIMEHTAYFPGWKVLVDGVETPINYTYEHSPGKLMFTVPAGTHAIESRFTEDTWDRILGDSLAIFGLMIYAVFVLVYIKTMIRTAKA